MISGAPVFVAYIDTHQPLVFCLKHGYKLVQPDFLIHITGQKELLAPGIIIQFIRVIVRKHKFGIDTDQRKVSDELIISGISFVRNCEHSTQIRLFKPAIKEKTGSSQQVIILFEFLSLRRYKFLLGFKVGVLVSFYQDNRGDTDHHDEDCADNDPDLDQKFLVSFDLRFLRFFFFFILFFILFYIPDGRFRCFLFLTHDGSPFLNKVFWAMSFHLNAIAVNVTTCDRQIVCSSILWMNPPEKEEGS